MNVRPYEKLRYYVQSESLKDEYLVDLSAYAGNGQCDCPNFKYKLGPKLQKIHPMDLAPNSVTMCKHIRAAREYLATEVIHLVMANESENVKEATEYGAKKLLFLAANRYCQVCGINWSYDCHHTRGRLGPLLMDERYWLAVCRECHTKIHKEVAWSKEMGYIEDNWNSLPVDTTKAVGVGSPVNDT